MPSGVRPRASASSVLDLPVAKVDVTEYELHRLALSPLRHDHVRALPAGVPTGHSGPRLQATTALLTGGYRLSKRQSANHAGGLLRRSHVDGRSLHLEQQTSQILAPVVRNCRSFAVPSRPTSTRPAGVRTPARWLWVVVTRNGHCVFTMLCREAKAGRARVAGRRLPSS